jgi:hypothetical protein
MPKTNVQLAIKHNDRVLEGACRLCGTVTQASAGPELFVEGTWDLVCRYCGRDREPALVALLTLAGAVNQSLRHLVRDDVAEESREAR